MKLSIAYRADYRYERPASLSPHRARIFPRTDLFVKVLSQSFATAPTADIQYRRDIADNLIASCFYPSLIEHLPFELRLELEVREKNPFHFLLDAHALHVPVAYTPDERALLGPFLVPQFSFQPPFPLAPSGPRPTVETLVTLTLWIHENLTYERRDEGDPFEPAETLSRGAGSCRDFAVLMADVLRLNGVAARLASGFVWEGDRPEEERTAQSALHAWVEAYLPGAGWIGMDPTNGALTDHHFITTAVGLRHADISPISGTYFGKTPIASHLETALDIQRIL